MRVEWNKDKKKDFYKAIFVSTTQLNESVCFSYALYTHT
jgi:hypothetical protein